MIDIYESAVEKAGRLGAVFERDDDTAYFYLLDMEKSDGSQIISAFNVGTANQMHADLPVSVRWSETAALVGLFIGGVLTAIFDVRSENMMGRYADRADDLWFQSN